MTRGILTILTFISVIFFPWPLTVLLALITAPFEPLVPLAAGIFSDALYFTPATGGLPLLSLLGAIASVTAFFVRTRLNPGIIGE